MDVPRTQHARQRYLTEGTQDESSAKGTLLNRTLAQTEASGRLLTVGHAEAATDSYNRT